jgi:hypothetical protein
MSILLMLSDLLNLLTGKQTVLLKVAKTLNLNKFGQITELPKQPTNQDEKQNHDKKRMLQWCLIGNFMTLVFVVALVLIYNDDPRFMSFGPNNHLIVISVKIDTWVKYGILLFCIAMINIIQVLSEDIANPILGFTVFNPDLTHVKGWTRLELQFYANFMFSIGAIRSVFCFY